MSRVLFVRLSDEEESVVDELLMRGGFRGEEHVAKLGISKVADHFDIFMSQDCFAVPYNPKLRILLERERTQRETPLLDGVDAAPEKVV